MELGRGASGLDCNVDKSNSTMTAVALFKVGELAVTRKRLLPMRMDCVTSEFTWGI